MLQEPDLVARSNLNMAARGLHIYDMEERQASSELINVDQSQQYTDAASVEDEQLVEAVQAYQCIWDTSSRAYKELPKEQNAWVIFRAS